VKVSLRAQCVAELKLRQLQVKRIQFIAVIRTFCKAGQISASTASFVRHTFSSGQGQPRANASVVSNMLSPL